MRALLSDPDILLLDEAMANLDDLSKQLVLSVLSEQKITVITSTHDPKEYKTVDSVIEIKLIDEQRVLRITK